MRSALLPLLLLTFFTKIFAQTTDIPLGDLTYQRVDEKDGLSDEKFSTTIKPFSRKAAYEFLRPDVGSYVSLMAQQYSLDSSKSKTVLMKKFYKGKSDLYQYVDNSLKVHFNPVFYLGAGQDNTSNTTTYITTRGVEFRGTIDNKIAFYTYLTENQSNLPHYVNAVRDSTLAVPFEGFWKQHNDTGVDFLRAQAYVDFAFSKSISAQLGFGKHFVGNGMRSMILSDYSNNYPYLRINTSTKTFDFTNIFAQLISGVQGGTFGISGTIAFNEKYLAFHHLNFKIKPNLHIGLFESVMFGDSTGGFKLEYLNPVVFYRSVEQQNGSSGNAMVGMDFKWNFLNRFSLYGQMVIDELVVSNAFSGNGWWGNRQGFQLGGKYFDALGIEGLMLQGEWNRARPYMYAHETGFTDYTHYNLSLAHPLGANFTELLGKAFYSIGDKWQFEGNILLAKYGNDLDGVNYGRNVLRSYLDRVPDGNGGVQEFGLEHLQGNAVDLSMLFFRASYMLKHNLFLDLEGTLRNEKDETGNLDLSSTIFGFSIRMNSPARTYLF